jgi:hypothetical protein
METVAMKLIEGHVYTFKGANYLVHHRANTQWLLQLVHDEMAAHWPYVGCLMGFVTSVGSPDWYMITCTGLGRPPQVKFDCVYDFVKLEECAHLSDTVADHRINEAVRDLLQGLKL